MEIKIFTHFLIRYLIRPIKRYFLWSLKWGAPTYLVMLIIILLYDPKTNFTRDVFYDWLITLPIGILVLAPLGSFFYRWFILTNRFNKETVDMVKNNSNAKDKN